MAHIHLIGIGGSGLSAIARLLAESGYVVSGSDRQISPLAESLRGLGVRVFAGHRPENIRGADQVVRSSAISDDNPEVRAAFRAGIPVMKRAEFIGELMAGRQGIAVAGTHGKTTTTAMIAWILTALGQDPSFLIGGVSANLGTNARAGKGPAFVIEADEYDRMFLGLQPAIAVVTNVEYDHPDCFPTPEAFHAAFRQFAGQVLPGGTLLICSDDRGAAGLLQSVVEGTNTRTYGLQRWLGRPCPDYCAVSLQANALGGFDFQFLPGTIVSLQVPGHHNVRNALAALGVTDLLGLPVEDAARALAEYRGAGRRFELRGEAGGVTVIDDYAHHPTEIRATLAAARARFPGRPIWACWQPHPYSRTRTLLADFAGSFAEADQVVVTEIYPAREADPGDFSARQVVAEMDHPGVYFAPNLGTAAALLGERLEQGDVLLVLSAGDGDWVSGEVLKALKNRRVVE